MGGCVSFQIKVQILAFNTDVCTALYQARTVVILTTYYLIHLLLLLPGGPKVS